MHYLLYGTGMQTWEYSPLYAIRSYAYLWLHALPACLHAHVLQTNKVTIPHLLSFQRLSLLLIFYMTSADLQHHQQLFRVPNSLFWYKRTVCRNINSVGNYLNTFAPFSIKYPYMNSHMHTHIEVCMSLYRNICRSFRLVLWLCCRCWCSTLYDVS